MYLLKILDDVLMTSQLSPLGVAVQCRLQDVRANFAQSWSIEFALSVTVKCVKSTITLLEQASALTATE